MVALGNIFNSATSIRLPFSRNDPVNMILSLQPQAHSLSEDNVPARHTHTPQICLSLSLYKALQWGIAVFSLHPTIRLCKTFMHKPSKAFISIYYRHIIAFYSYPNQLNTNTSFIYKQCNKFTTVFTFQYMFQLRYLQTNKQKTNISQYHCRDEWTIL